MAGLPLDYAVLATADELSESDESQRRYLWLDSEGRTWRWAAMAPEDRSTTWRDGWFIADAGLRRDPSGRGPFTAILEYGR